MVQLCSLGLNLLRLFDVVILIKMEYFLFIRICGQCLNTAHYIVLSQSEVMVFKLLL